MLIDRRGNVKLCDFGLARAFQVPIPAYTHEVVTMYYRPPEILIGMERYATPVDIWSAGCVFAEIVTLRPLFDGASELGMLRRIFGCLGAPSARTWPQGAVWLAGCKLRPQTPAGRALPTRVPGLCRSGVDLLERMVVCNPGARISAAAALRHPYFAHGGAAAAVPPRLGPARQTAR